MVYIERLVDKAREMPFVLFSLRALKIWSTETQTLRISGPSVRRGPCRLVSIPNIIGKFYPITDREGPEEE
jgi:hypothetical protein